MIGGAALARYLEGLPRAVLFATGTALLLLGVTPRAFLPLPIPGG